MYMYTFNIKIYFNKAKKLILTFYVHIYNSGFAKKNRRKLG